MKMFTGFLLCLSTNALCVSEKFEMAATHYNQQQFDQAYTILKDLNPKNAPVLYNMGNCAYKKNEFDHALIWWRCAHATASAALKNTIEHNIGIVEKKLNKSAQKSSLKNILAFYRSIALIIFQLFFLISWFSLLLFIKKYKHGTKYTASFFALLLFVSILSGIALGFKYHILNQRRGIVMKHNVSLFAGPDEQYHVLGSLDSTSEVIVLEQRPSWYKVSTEQGSGWVARDSIVVL